MKAPIFAVLMLASVASHAHTLAWDWAGNEADITEFRLFRFQEVYQKIADPSVRNADVGDLPDGWYKMKACIGDVCSPYSNALYIPKVPTSFQFTESGVAWAWDGNENWFEEFRIYQDGELVQTITDSAVRAADIADITAGAYTIKACTEGACSAASNAVYAVPAPKNIRLVE